MKRNLYGIFFIDDPRVSPSSCHFLPLVKALAMRVRQLAGIEDPQPTSVLLDHPADGTADPEKREGRPEAGVENYFYERLCQ